MTKSSSTTKFPRGRQRRLRWVAVLAVSLAITLGAALMPFGGSLHTVASVHAFSKQTRAAGAAVFHDKGCEHCHGVDGIGTDRGPDLSGIGKKWNKSQIERQIREGGGGMPPFGDALQPDEVKELVDYLSAKRKAPQRFGPAAAPQAHPDDSGS